MCNACRATTISDSPHIVIAMQPAIDFEQLANAIGDAIVISDAAGDITYWNPAATRMFGYTKEEALGKTLDLIIPERLRGRHWEGYHKTMATGQTRYGNDVLRVPAVDKAGKALSIAFTVALLHSPQGELNGIVAVIRDETARFQEERALKKRITELEAQAQQS
ncbi:Sensor protein FixL [Paraburkholderia hiiakae]|uniref:Sensor protein FixL n=2 Tax=Paraburkholderia hiiakae TaxID=1081782 RepID=A0ABM8NNY8_9BURK|nr:Sensor protein FixL [Paraburkholderia hiiakae]